MAIGISIYDEIVYYGPNPINYAKIGRIKAKTKVTIIWREGNWFYIEYFDGKYKIRGYIQDTFVSYIIGNVVSVQLVSIKKLASDNTISCLGPIPKTYARAGSVFKYEPLKVFNVSLGSYSFVEYRIMNGLKKRAFIPSKAIYHDASCDLIPLVGERLADFSDESAYGYGNFYRRASLRGQCTWYCWGRAKEKCNKRLMLSYPNNAQNWYENCFTGFTMKVPATVRPLQNSIACFTESDHGHVVFIEAIERDLVFFTEASVNSNNTIDASDGILKVKKVNEFQNHLGKTLKGYIIL